MYIKLTCTEIRQLFEKLTILSGFCGLYSFRGELKKVMDVPVQQPKRQQPPALIVLTGFRATGKSAVGKALAHRLGCQFVDTDTLVTDRLGCSIANSVQTHGWQRFRACEREVLMELSASPPTVVATGGGAVLHPTAWPALCARAFVIWLQADVQTILSRLAADKKTAEQRPSLSGQDAAEEIPMLLQERESLYRAGADLVVNTGNGTPDELAVMLYEQLFR